MMHHGRAASACTSIGHGLSTFVSAGPGLRQPSMYPVDGGMAGGVQERLEQGWQRPEPAKRHLTRL